MLNFSKSGSTKFFILRALFALALASTTPLTAQQSYIAPELVKGEVVRGRLPLGYDTFAGITFTFSSMGSIGSSAITNINGDSAQLNISEKRISGSFRASKFDGLKVFTVSTLMIVDYQNNRNIYYRSNGDVEIGGTIVGRHPVDFSKLSASIVNDFAAPKFSKSPASILTDIGQNVTLSWECTGDGPQRYFIYKLTSTTEQFVAYTDSPSYTFTMRTEDAGQYKITASVSWVASEIFKADSDKFTLSLRTTPPVIVTQPAAAIVSSGSTASLSVVVSGTPPFSYQWKKSGAAIAGATSATYSLTSAAVGDAGTYTVVVTNGAGSVTSNAATLTINTPPAITTQPSAATVTAGSAASFSVVATGTVPLSYQWRKDGAAISSATSSTYTIASTKTTDAGSYTVVVTNSAGSVTSSAAATLTVNALPRLYSLAVRTALDANQILIVGFTMSGGAKNVLLRAAGPTLGAFGVPETMVDPKLDLYSGSSLVTSNDNWGGSSSLAATFQSAGAFAFASATSLDAALVASINGGRTAHVYGPAAGAVLVEGYDVGTGDAQRFTSLSARNRVGTGANILIAGFSLAGEGKRNLLIRAVGPTLSAFGVPSVLTDPKLEIYQGSTKIVENDNWSSTLSTTFSSVGAFGLTQGSRDAAITVSLPAGGYTVQVSGADGGVGEALVEIYELP
jgi:hypothetical protein